MANDAKGMAVLLAVAVAAALGLSGGVGQDPPAAIAQGKDSSVQASGTEGAPQREAIRYSPSGYDISRLSDERVAELAEALTPEQRRILLRKGTEPAFCGNLLDNPREGVYVCRLCKLPLFASDAKFKSGTGWPSFYAPVDEAHVRTERDSSHGMVRTEILCERCGGHLGHVFADGPPPSGLRFCVNSESLEFFEKGADMPEAARPIRTETAYFAGGCFWGVEDRFQQVPGVIDAVSGYQGGTVENPSYKQVCGGQTGHAESVRVIFDPSRVSYRQLLEHFFKFHDPTQLNRQGPDVGTQYRSAIFAASEEQRKHAEAFIEEQRRSERFKEREIVTQVNPMAPFYEAEEYHQDYHAKHGGSCAIPGG